MAFGIDFKVDSDLGFWLSQVRLGRAFGGTTLVTGGASQYPETQILNPANSGVTVIVFAIQTNGDTTQSLHIATHNTALGTLGAGGTNLLSGGAAPAAELRTGTPTSLDGTRFALWLNNSTSGLMQTPLRWIMELPAGKGLVVAGIVVGTTLAVSYQWVELT